MQPNTDKIMLNSILFQRDEGDKQQIQVGLTASETAWRAWDAVKMLKPTLCGLSKQSVNDVVRLLLMYLADAGRWNCRNWPSNVSQLTQTRNRTISKHALKFYLINSTDQIRNWSHIIDLISYHFTVLFLYLLFVFLLERPLKKLKVPAFQIGSGWNSAGLFLIDGVGFLMRCHNFKLTISG